SKHKLVEDELQHDHSHPMKTLMTNLIAQSARGRGKRWWWYHDMLSAPAASNS
ncbi:unnamed protein product, partial [Ectocarpus sp. 13 AM-2016]